jgi:outer membrane protein assembly factor BamB
MRNWEVRRFLRRASSMITLLAVFGLFFWAPPASAAPRSVPDAGTVQTDGRVWAILRLGSRVYLGGDFTHVNGVARNRLAAINATTGQLRGWNPNANGSVRTLAASPDGTRLYAGGSFTSVGGTYRGRLAALDAASGALDPSWKPGTANSTVRAIAVSGSRVYIGGDFTTLKGLSRERLALVDGATGALDPSWLPAANASVRTLAPSPNGSRLYVGGDFTAVSGQSRPYLASLGTRAGGLAKRFRPPQPNGLVHDLALSGRRVFTAEGGVGGAAAAYDAATGTRAWRRKANGDVQAVALLAGTVYVGGHFDMFSGQTRRAFAAVAVSTGALDRRWTPSARPIWPGVWAMTKDALRGRLYAGGSFTHVSGRLHQGFAQFS